MVVFYSTFLSDTTNLVTWIVIICTILVGLLVGFFAMKLEKIGACLLAGWGGFCCGVLLNETVLYYATSVALSWSINVACALVAAILAWFLFNHAIIISTALIGSYFTMRGVGLYAGGFPNEYVLMEMISTGEVAQIDPIFYAYLAGIVVMTIIASLVQFKMFHAMEEKEKHPYDTMA